MGFDLLEHVKKSNYENTALIAPAGYGKTTLLKKCFTLLSKEDFVVPCYIDINDLAGKGIYRYIQNNYFGSIDLSLNNFESSFINAIKSNCKYRYVFLMDNLENILLYSDKNFYKEIISFFNFAKSNNNCTIIVGSTYCDELVDGFNIIELRSLSANKIISVLQKQIGIEKIDYNNLDIKLYSVLSNPYNLKQYINLLKNNFNKYANLNSEYEILNNSLAEIENKYDYFNIVPRLAFYLAENNCKCVSENFIANSYCFPIKVTELSTAIQYNLRKDGITPFNINNIDDFYYYLKNVVCKKQKVLSVLGNENRVIVFDSQILVDFFASKYIKNKLKYHSEKIDILNEFLMNDIITHFLATQARKVDILKLKSELKKCRQYRSNPIETANIVNILYYYNNESLENCDLSDLDLRYVNFIGKNCRNVDFSNSCFTNTCFIPCITEDITFYSISDNGAYFALGNKNSVFIVNSKTSMICNSIIREDKEIKKLEYALSWGFVVIYADSTAEIIDVNYSYTIDSAESLCDLFLPHNNVNLDESDFKLYGKLCDSTKEGFALFHSTSNTYYGEGYILIDFNNYIVKSICTVKPHTKLSYVVQNNNEIECLIEKAGKPLKSICFNDSTKEIYYKQYSSLVGKYIKYPDGTKILFDTESINDFIKWRFLNKKLHEYKSENITFAISNAKAKFPEPLSEHRNYINNSNQRFFLQSNNTQLTFVKQFLLDENCYCRTSFSWDDCFVYKNYKDKVIIDIDEYDMILQKRTLPKLSNLNITKINNETFLHSCNAIHKFHLVENNVIIDYAKEIPLSFTDEYLYAIERFPWSKAIKIAFEKYDVKPEEDFEKVVENIVSELLKPIIKELKENLCEFNSENWTFVFSSYIRSLIISSIRKQSDILSDDQYIVSFKSWCFPCDSGINYYNGMGCCYIQLDENFNVQYETEYTSSCCLLEYRNGVHYTLETNCYNQTNNIELWDIHKPKEQNKVEKPIIPIYDLNLYGANFDGAYWIDENGNILDIIQKQTKIPTVNVKMNIDYD